MTQLQPPQELVRDFVIAGHGNLAKVSEMLAQHPQLLNAAYPWSDTDSETALQAAAQVGSKDVAEFLLSKGAPLDICTAAMLGRKDEVEHILMKDSAKLRATGAHGITLLTHAALSGNLTLVRMLVERGAKEGMSPALHNAVSKGHFDVAQWLMRNGTPDLNWKNFQGKTALTVALERKDTRIVGLLRERGTSE